MIDDINLRSAQGAIQGNLNAGTQTTISLAPYITTGLVDIDGSETLSITINNIPVGAVITTASSASGITPVGGSVTISQSDLASAGILLPGSFVGTMSLGIVATSTEPNGSTAPTTGTLNLEVLSKGVTMTDIVDPGLNHAPDAKDDAPTTALVEDAATTTLTGNAITGTGTGNVTDTDVDAGAVIRVTGVVPGVGISPSGTTPLGSPVTVSGRYGTLQIAANGSYTYALDNARPATQNLTAGQTGYDVFTYRIADGQGDFDTATITLKVTGTQDTTANTPTTQALTVTGLNGEYYGYNDSVNPGSGYRLHADDALSPFGSNLESVEDMEFIINGRNAARGGANNIVGSADSAVTDAADARFSAKTLNYGFSPAVNTNLGSNPNVAAGTALSTTNDATNNAFSTFLGTDDVSAKAEQGAGAATLSAAGTGLGKTTDSAIRLSGKIYFERGFS